MFFQLKSDLILQHSFLPSPTHSPTRSLIPNRHQVEINFLMIKEKFLRVHEISERGRNATKGRWTCDSNSGVSERTTPSNLQAPCEVCYKAQDHQLTWGFCFLYPLHSTCLTATFSKWCQSTMVFTRFYMNTMKNTHSAPTICIKLSFHNILIKSSEFFILLA